MVFRFIIVLCLLGFATAGDYEYNNPNTYNAVSNQGANYGFDYRAQQLVAPAAAVYYPPAPAKYEFSYGVHDETTGDIKSHSEQRDGYNVRGVYSVVDPDGFKRVVSYTADQHSGFNAVVNREPVAIKIATPVVKFQPSVELAFANVQQVQNQQLSSSQEVPQIDESVQTIDSYATPPVQDGEGPYP
ncbi:cuticle protein 8-like [Teleopsis dalmanni]|uniref:cuticle protein 8-like n=1 Tax=Teleopsis dalmanni TaxID=139649 RepID=UPI0018CD5803|nr:cuticle protein 8-like [Teleopsis dalmanni]